jgi:hypothetical protein
MKIGILANLNLLPEICRRKWHFTSMKMAEASTSGLKRARASGPIVFGPFEYSAQSTKNYSAFSNSVKSTTVIKFYIFETPNLKNSFCFQIFVQRFFSQAYPFYTFPCWIQKSLNFILFTWFIVEKYFSDHSRQKTLD